MTPTLRETNGQYAIRTLEVLCVCGHHLGAHTAARSHGEQPCLNDDCGCNVFQKAKARK